MQRLTESSLETQVEELAAHFFSIDDIAVFTGINAEKLRADIAMGENDPVAIAYRRGKLKTQILLRFDALKYALHGSPDASAEMRKYLTLQNINENA